MKNKMLTKAKRKLKKNKVKNTFMAEMAEDMMDIVKKAKKIIKK